MPLTELSPIGFIPTLNADRARQFYEETLGLTFERDDNYAMVFLVGPTRTLLRVVRAYDFTPQPFTIFGWEVSDLPETVAELAGRGVEFLRFGFFEQDELGIWQAPDGSLIAWFKDPDGNTLSLSHHPG